MNDLKVSNLVNSDAEVAGAIHAVMLAAYRVEAELLGVKDFAPLRRAPAQIRGSASQFLGICVAGTLAAVAELETSLPGCVHIVALVVRPNLFRTGLATAVLKHIFGTHAGQAVTVATAAGNRPALSLYAAHGFREQRRWTTGDGVAMATLRCEHVAQEKSMKPTTEQVAAAAAAAEEMTKLQGVWRQIAYERDGVIEPPDERGWEPTTTFAGDTFVVTLADGSTPIRGTYKLDPTKSPKTVDWLDSIGEDAGKTLPGIYALVLRQPCHVDSRA